GTILHEILSGQRAFPGASAVESGYAILHHEPEPLPAAVPPSVAQVVRRCLEKDLGRRYQSARDLAFQLEMLRAPTKAPTVGAAPPDTRGWRWWWAVAAGAVCVIAVAGAFWLAGPGRRLASTPGQRAGVEPGAPAVPGTAPSIAVLPFVNLSSDKEQ